MSNGGNIISFYSYKGGVGRSMALANVAALLSQQSKRVLVIDLDLEAPGLHRYFLDSSVPGRMTAPDALGGAIEFFTELRVALETVDARELGDDETLSAAQETVTALLDQPRFRYTVRIKNPDLPDSTGTALEFMPAGRFDSTYPERVRCFDWVAFYERFGHSFSLLISALRGRYDYVLIDSRTGITDVGSVCTVLLPDTLVLAFAPNEQSLHGAIEMARQAAEQRKRFTPERPLFLLPLAGRIVGEEDSLLNDFMEQVRQRFQLLFNEIYGRDAVDLTTYFRQVRIPHKGYYGYWEKIAVERESPLTQNSMAAAFQNFMGYLSAKGPEELIAVSVMAAQVSVTKTAVRHRTLRESIVAGHSALSGQLREYLERFDEAIEEHELTLAAGEQLDDAVFFQIGRLTPYRDEFVDVLETLCKYVSDDALFQDPLIEFLQGLLRLQGRRRGSRPFGAWHDGESDHIRFFLLELFLYVMAVLLRGKRFAIAAALLAHKYYKEENGTGSFHSYGVFRHYIASLEEARNKRIHKGTRLSVTTDLLKDRATLPSYPFEDLKQADFVLLFNAILHGERWRWYPETLIYEDHRPFRLFSMAESARYFADLQTLFRVRDRADLETRYQEGKARWGISDTFFLGQSHQTVSIAMLANLKRLATL